MSADNYKPAPGQVRIWVDTQSGTWGDAQHIRFVDLGGEALADWEQMSDSERALAADEVGFKA